MALKFCDGFDSYAATADLSKKWMSSASPWVWSSTAGRTGGGAVQAATTGGSVIRTAVILSTTRNALAFAFKASAAPGSTLLLFQVVNTVGSQTFALRLTNTGGVHVSNSNNGSTSATSANICDNNWHWIEADYQDGAVCGLRVDGVVVQNGAIGASSGGTPAYAQFLSVTGITITIDDFILYDTSGSSFTPALSFPLGDRQISTLRPSSDDAVQFTRSTGLTNFGTVDETNADATDYVESGTSGHQDTYDYADLGGTVSSINAVVVNSYLHNPNPGTVNHRAVAKRGGVSGNGTSSPTPTTPRILQEPFYVDPNGGAAWTQTNLNAAQFGINIP